MAKLNSQDYPFKPKSGLFANLNSTANKNSAYDGEIVYTTDTKQLFVFNGTEFEAVTKFTQFIYNSSGSQSGNRFNNWGDLIDVLATVGGERRIYFEQNETLPAGTYNLNNTVLYGDGVNQQVVVTLPTGFIISDWNYGGVTAGLRIVHTGTNYVVDTAANFTLLVNQGFIACTNEAFFNFRGAGFDQLAAISLDQGSIIYGNDGVTYTEAIRMASPAFIPVYQGNDCHLENNAVKGTGGFYIMQVLDANSVFPLPTHANLTPDLFMNVLGVDDRLIDHENTDSGLIATNVNAALAELANEKRDIIRNVLTSTATVANTTAETTVFTGSIPANTLEVGQVVHADIFGVFSTANASDTFTLRLKIGGTTIASIVSVGKNVTNTPIDVDFIFTIRSLGVSGAVATYSKVSLDNLGTSAGSSGTTTIDTTIAEDVTITIQWGAANVNNSVSITQGWLDIDG